MYFSYHVVHGNFGMEARKSLMEDIARLDLDLSHLTEERRMLDRNVALMRPDQIDPDMLDEQARRVLNLARPDEIIVMDVVARSAHRSNAAQ